MVFILTILRPSFRGCILKESHDPVHGILNDRQIFSDQIKSRQIVRANFFQIPSSFSDFFEVGQELVDFFARRTQSFGERGGIRRLRLGLTRLRFSFGQRNARHLHIL